MSIRKRQSPEQSRAAALVAARDLLIEAGPPAVTLKAVAERIGRTHANVLHHFGSAAGLQQALTDFLAAGMLDSIALALQAAKRGEVTPRAAVDRVFDAFALEGGGPLVGWTALSRNGAMLDPLVHAIHQLVHDACAEGQGDAPAAMQRDTLVLVLLALGDWLLGEPLSLALDLPRDAARLHSVAMLRESLDRAGQRAAQFSGDGGA